METASPGRRPILTTQSVRHVGWVERKRPGMPSSLESDTRQLQFAKMKMMGFAKGSTHPTGCADPAGFVEAVVEE